MSAALHTQYSTYSAPTPVCTCCAVSALIYGRHDLESGQDHQSSRLMITSLSSLDAPDVDVPRNVRAPSGEQQELWAFWQDFGHRTTKVVIRNSSARTH